MKHDLKNVQSCNRRLCDSISVPAAGRWLFSLYDLSTPMMHAISLHDLSWQQHTFLRRGYRVASRAFKPTNLATKMQITATWGVVASIINCRAAWSAKCFDSFSLGILIIQLEMWNEINKFVSQREIGMRVTDGLRLEKKKASAWSLNVELPRKKRRLPCVRLCEIKN